MHHVEQMIQSHPQRPNMEVDALSECIHACFDCAQTCSSCADACLAESHLQDLVHCIRLNHDCADICQTTGRVLSRQTEPDMALLRRQVEVCALACRACADECETHAEMHEHCRVCAESCRACEQACEDLLAQSGPVT